MSSTRSEFDQSGNKDTTDNIEAPAALLSSNTCIHRSLLLKPYHQYRIDQLQGITVHDGTCTATTILTMQSNATLSLPSSSSYHDTIIGQVLQLLSTSTKPSVNKASSSSKKSGLTSSDDTHTTQKPDADQKALLLLKRIRLGYLADLMCALITADATQNRVIFACLDGPTIVANIIIQHKTIPTILAVCCRIVQNSVVGDVSNKIRNDFIVRLNILQHVFAMLQSFPDDVHVCSGACAAIDNLLRTDQHADYMIRRVSTIAYSNNDDNSASTLAILAKTLKRYPKNVEIQKRVTSTMWFLSEWSEQYHVFIMKSGIFSALASAIGYHEYLLNCEITSTSSININRCMFYDTIIRRARAATIRCIQSLHEDSIPPDTIDDSDACYSYDSIQAIIDFFCNNEDDHDDDDEHTVKQSNEASIAKTNKKRTVDDMLKTPAEKSKSSSGSSTSLSTVRRISFDDFNLIKPRHLPKRYKLDG